MVNEECRQALAIVQEKNRLNKGELHLNEISANLGSAMKNIVLTQKKFELKRFSERYPALTNTSVVLYKAFGTTPPTWGSLFSTQLDNVGKLNQNLVGLIYVTSNDFHLLQDRLFTRIDSAKQNLLKFRDSQSLIPGLKSGYEEHQLSKIDFNPDDETHYDLLKQEIVLEDKLLSGISAVSLSSKVHTRDIENIEFLKKHLLIYRGTIHSAQDLALTTHQMCETLGELVRVYEMTSATRDCLEQVYAGVSHLKGYTDSLQELYRKTDATLDKITASPNPLKLSADNLSGIASRGIGRMLPNES